MSKSPRDDRRPAGGGTGAAGRKGQPTVLPSPREGGRGGRAPPLGLRPAPGAQAIHETATWWSTCPSVGSGAPTIPQGREGAVFSHLPERVTSDLLREALVEEGPPAREESGM